MTYNSIYNLVIIMGNKNTDICSAFLLKISALFKHLNTYLKSIRICTANKLFSSHETV